MSTAHVCSKRSLATASFARSDLLRTARGQPPRQIAKISWSTDRFVSSGAMISYWSALRCFAGAICGVSDVPNTANPACRHGHRVAVPLFRACMLGAGQQPVIFFLRTFCLSGIAAQYPGLHLARLRLVGIGRPRAIPTPKGLALPAAASGRLQALYRRARNRARRTAIACRGSLSLPQSNVRESATSSNGAGHRGCRCC